MKHEKPPSRIRRRESGTWQEKPEARGQATPFSISRAQLYICTALSSATPLVEIATNSNPRIS